MQPPSGDHVVHHDFAPIAAATLASSPSAVLATAAMATATKALAAAVSPTASEATQDGPQGECRLLGSFALVVQAALGALALLSLVFKRWRERPQRPVKIWFFDASKQVFGSVLVHIANVFMSMLTSGRFSIKLEPGTTERIIARAVGDDYIPNPCSFYLLNLAIDTTLGIPILIVLLRVLTALAATTPMGKPLESIQSGHYGNPPRASWWFKQSIIYFGGLFGMKLCVLIIFLLFPWISKVGDWALGWTEGNEKLQIAFVMMIFPLIMNAMQYYIIDSFIKSKEMEHERLPSEDPEEDTTRFNHGTRLAGHSQVSDVSSDEDDADHRADKLHGQARQTKSLGRTRIANRGEYDPDLDGDAQTLTGSGSSRRANGAKAASTELLPKE
ncbi:hypothetical protein HIM_07009 [Hirsutella minnesotensis 3608]|uniref:Vacuolar membrane protein n=1 Tax=Hirsutella minnesotensis 3608 TaxID=1043627 RepID=A0A0F7ZIG4_9HYPO|nr:hypothetical protein HIM_07009 [Hirsutella minnesotensis 3608]